MSLPTTVVPVRPLESTGAGKAFASGPVPYRIVLAGDASIVGDGALGDDLATELATRTGHGVDVEQVIATPLADGGAVLGDRDLARLDALVLVLDPERDRLAGRSDDDAIRYLLAGLGERLTVGSPLVVVVPPPFALGLAPRQLDELTERAQVHTDALTPVVRLQDATPGTSPEVRSAEWAGAIADATAKGLIDPMVQFLPDDHYDEDLRLDAVDLLPPRDGLWVAQFQRIVEEAREAYGTQSAALSVIDADHTRYGVTAGFENKVLRRGQSICNRVLRTYGGLIVGDAQLDLRFARNPDVKSGGVRFYAGYRIETAEGAPLGSLCVFDPTPRGVTNDDLVDLRDLAIAAQQRLWEFQRAVA